MFGFSHEEYPTGTENAPDIGALYLKVCGIEETEVNGAVEQAVTINSTNLHGDLNTPNLMYLRQACADLARRHGLHDTFIARQRYPESNTSYRMQQKPIPFTISHVSVSTPRWSLILHKHQSTNEPMYANLFTIWNAMYSIGHRAEADQLIRINNNNQKIKDLIEIHSDHTVFLRDHHRMKWERYQREKEREVKVRSFAE